MTRIAQAKGLRGGWSLDVAAADPVSGRTWDFTKEEDRQKARSLLRRDRPRVLIASPPCTSFSALQKLRGGPSAEARVEGEVLFNFAVEMCQLQQSLGGLFILEHPASSAAWKLPCVRELVQKGNVVRSSFHMCRFGMKASDAQGVGWVKKPTVVLSNSWAISERLEWRCKGEHRHVHHHHHHHMTDHHTHKSTWHCSMILI